MQNAINSWNGRKVLSTISKSYRLKQGSFIKSTSNRCLMWSCKKHTKINDCCFLIHCKEPILTPRWSTAWGFSVGVGGIEAELRFLANLLSSYAWSHRGEIYQRDACRYHRRFSTKSNWSAADRKVVGKFVEYFGPGYRHLSLADRATLANMAPEYGATCGFVRLIKRPWTHLAATGRRQQVELVAAYAKANHFFYDEAIVPTYTKTITIDLAEVQPALAGPSARRSDFASSSPSGFWTIGHGCRRSQRLWSFRGRMAKAASVTWPDAALTN